MKEITVNLYGFGELPPEIQEEAWEQDQSRYYLGESYNDDLITTALDEFFRTWRDCLEYAESIEYYAEEAAANEWEYTADGRRWPH